MKYRKFLKKRNETKSVGTTANLEFYVEVLKCGNSSILLETSKRLWFMFLGQAFSKMCAVYPYFNVSLA
ncbi:hypothetical protein C4X99_06335 [Leptospira interrogans serovar Geyaweera]|nr:hypothetical protein C4X99_06335 [Leptospira interrogans serovar Geyaweera]